MSWCNNELNLIKNPKISNKSPNTYTLVRYMDKQIERSLKRSKDRHIDRYIHRYIYTN